MRVISAEYYKRIAKAALESAAKSTSLAAVKLRILAADYSERAAKLDPPKDGQQRVTQQQQQPQKE